MFYILGNLFGKITSLAGIISFLFGFFGKSFKTVFIGVIIAAFTDTIVLSIIKSSMNYPINNFSFSLIMAFIASCLVGFITYFIRSKKRK